MSPPLGGRQRFSSRDGREFEARFAEKYAEKLSTYVCGTCGNHRVYCNCPPASRAQASTNGAVLLGAEPIQLADRIRAGLLTTEQIRNLEPPEPLVDGLLFHDSLALLYGPSGVGKTHVAVDIAQHVAYGAWWQHKQVKGGPVLYVVAEGASGIGIRVNAWETHHRLTGEIHPLRWLPWAVEIYQPAWASALAEVVAEIAPALVVLDTFARCAVGAEENSARDVGLIIAHLDQVRQAAGSCVLLVHHAGKDGSAGARGSSALKGAMDTEIELTGDSAQMVLKNSKQKNAPEASPIRLGLRHVEGTDSVVVDRHGDSESGDKLPASVAATLAALGEIDVPGGVPASAWRAACELPDRTFFRHRAGLIEHAHVVNVGTDKQPRYRPADRIEEDS